MQSIQSLMDQQDFSHVNRRLTSIKGWSDAEVRRAETAYRQYLVLLMLNPGVSFPVPETVDEYGHTHLLFTEQLASFEEQAGVHLTHRPLMDPDGWRELMPQYQEATLKQIEELFGSAVDPVVWVRDRCVCLWISDDVV